MPNAEAVNANFNSLLRKKAEFVNGLLQQSLADYKDIDADLGKALHYTLNAPGKRIRSALLLWCCELIAGRSNRNAEISAVAIEMVHTYSLVHDDLPAIDNDDLRRGQPTCHKAFDEATAVLTGDALLTLAFEILANQIDQPATAIRLIGRLSEAAGPAGMIAGQMADLRAENTACDEQTLRYIHINKTAKLFRCAAEMGAVCGRAGDNQLNRLGEYGLKIGLGFQIADDILDICASDEQLGKTAGKDKEAGKATYPAILGMDKSKKIARQLTAEAIAALEPFGHAADTLRQMAKALLKRTR